MKSTTNQRKKHVGYKSVAIFIRLAVVTSQIPNQRNPVKFYEKSNL